MVDVEVGRWNLVEGEKRGVWDFFVDVGVFLLFSCFFDQWVLWSAVVVSGY